MKPRKMTFPWRCKREIKWPQHILKSEICDSHELRQDKSSCSERNVTHSCRGTVSEGFLLLGTICMYVWTMCLHNWQLLSCKVGCSKHFRHDNAINLTNLAFLCVAKFYHLHALEEGSELFYAFLPLFGSKLFGVDLQGDIPSHAAFFLLWPAWLIKN